MQNCTEFLESGGMLQLWLQLSTAFKTFSAAFWHGWVDQHTGPWAVQGTYTTWLNSWLMRNMEGREMETREKCTFSSRGRLYGCNVRLLSGRVSRGEEKASVIVFIGLPVPGRCTWHLSTPGGAANYFKLISRCWMGRLMGQDVREWVSERHRWETAADFSNTTT